MFYWQIQKLNVKLSLCMQWRQTRTEEVHLQSFLTSALDGVVSFVPWPLWPPEKEPVAPTEQDAGEPQGQTGIFQDDTRLLLQQGIEPWIIQLKTFIQQLSAQNLQYSIFADFVQFLEQTLLTLVGPQRYWCYQCMSQCT
jgi:hypothetical protein